MMRHWSAAAVAAAALSVAPAQAATVGTTVQDGKTLVVFAADAGRDDFVMLTRPTTGSGYRNDRVEFYNRYGGMRIEGDECSTAGDPANTTTIDCPQHDGVLILLSDGNDETDVGEEIGRLPVIVAGGPGDDRIDAAGGDDLLLGEEGDDRFPLSPGDNTVDGGPGNDLLVSGPGAETLDGGPGDDTIEEGSGGGGADTMIGGDGTDTLLFDEHGRVTVSLDDQPGDGADGEGDNARSDIENVDVDAGGSVVVGSAAANLLRSSGRGERTVLDGAGGNDVLHGDVGSESILGGEGDDQLVGGLGDDELDGGPGRDSFVADGVDGFGSGADVVRAADGVAENVSCGGGPDTATLDKDDLVTADPGNLCESITRMGGQDIDVKDTTAPTLALGRIGAIALRTVLRKGLRVPVGCSESCSARVVLRLPAATARRLRLPGVLARAQVQVPDTRQRLVRLRPAPRVRARLGRTRAAFGARLVVAATDAAGNRTQRTMAVRVTR